jgi:exodeoxyribonuclease VII small subunit
VSPRRSRADAELSLEEAMGRLEEIVRRIESGAPELDESLRLFEEGVLLLRRAEEVLSGAEGRMHRLLEVDGADRVEPVEPE